MPASLPGITGSMISSLTSVAMIGEGVPKYSRGVALGLLRWVPQIRVQTVDTGSAGAGKCVPFPFLVPTPLLYGNLIASMTAQKLTGPFMPVFVNGLATGLSLSFAQMLIMTNHPSVGTGAGVARFRAPPATSSILQGFQAAGMNGPAVSKKARALGKALDRTLASLVMPIAIVGSASPVPSTGTGFGQII